MVSTASSNKSADRFNVGLHRWAVVVFICTVFLLFVGGTVTSNDAGLAVPDWPSTFGENMFLYPPTKWVGDVLFEHGHRLAGSAVGMASVVLAVVCQLRERRRWLRTFGWIMLAAVIVQGVLGGLRVTERMVQLAIVHGCLGQLFLCMTAGMVLFTSRWWIDERPRSTASVSTFGRRLCLLTAFAVFLQLVAGAVYRHLAVGFAIHVVGAIVVTMIVSAVVMWASGEHREEPLLHRCAKWLGGLFVLQLLLGVVSYLVTSDVDSGAATPFLAWFIPSLHVVVGALILAVSAILTTATFALPSVSQQAVTPASAGEVTVA